MTMRRARWLSEFEDVDEVARWATALGASVNRREIRKAWNGRQTALANGMEKDYRLFVVERPRQRTRLEIYRRGPKRPRRMAAYQERREADQP